MPTTTNGLPYPTNSSTNDVPADLGSLATAADGLLWRTRIPTTKGDLLTRDASANTRLAVSANGLILRARSAQATGLAWETQDQKQAWFQIGWVSLASAQATVVFSSLGSYRDLELIATVRGDTAATTTTFLARPNGTASGYYTVFYRTDGTTVTVGENTSNTSAECGLIPAGTATANRFGMVNLTITNYRQVDPATGSNGLQDRMQIHARTINYASTTNYAITGACGPSAAITSLTLLPLAGNFAANSTFALYGRN